MKIYRNTILTLLFIVSSCLRLSASTNDSVYVAGKLVDAITNEPIEDANLTFMRTDSLVVSQGRPIDWCKKYGITDGTVLITYNIPVPNTGKYIIHITSPKYEDEYIDIEIPDKLHGKRPESFDVADIRMNKVHLLGEAVVHASKVMMVNKGDTIVYNASAFQLAEGSMLDALIAKLPGVRLTEDGQIFVNEQYVSCLLVNGKDFFQGNPSVALKNLPAYTVNKIKTYRRGNKADYLFKRDSIERLQDDLVLDVALKKEYIESWLANANVGYGTDDRYVARLFGMRFSSKRRIAAFANLNNIGITQQPGENIEHSAEILPIQPFTDKSVGMDFYTEFGESKSSYSSVFTATHSNKNVITETAANSILADYHAFSRSLSSAQSSRTELTWRNLLCLPLPKVYTEFTLGGEYGRFRSDATSRSIELDKLPYESYRLASLDSVFNHTAQADVLRALVNSYERQTFETTHRGSFIASGLSKWESPFTGNPLSLYAEIAYEKQHYSNAAAYTLNSIPASNTLSQKQAEKSYYEDTRGKASLNYEYSLPANLKLLAKYEFAAQRTNSDRRLDTLYILPDVGVAQLFAADLHNSFNRNLRRITHTPEMQLRYASPRWLVSLHVPLRMVNVRLHESRLSTEASHPRLSYTVFEPSLTINGNSWAFSYAYREEEPNMVFFTGLSDTSDPLSVMIGNPSLHNKGLHTASINYSKSNAEKVRNFGLSGTFSVSHNETTLQRLYDRQTGVSTYTPLNVNGNYDLQLHGNFTQAIDKHKHFFPEITTQIDIARSVGYGGVLGNNNVSSRIAMKSFTFNNQLGIKYQAGDISLKFLIRSEWLHGVSSEATSTDISIRKFRYAFVASLPILWDIQLGTDLSLYTKYGYEAQSMNTNNLVLNATLSKSILRNKNLTLQLTAFDLFNSLSNIQQSINAQGRIETWSNTLHRYVMLHLIYRFNKKSK